MISKIINPSPRQMECHRLREGTGADGKACSRY